MVNRRLSAMDRRASKVTRSNPKRKRKQEKNVSPSLPEKVTPKVKSSKTQKKEAKSQYQEYKKSSFVPKATKITEKKSSLESAQKAFSTGQKARASQQKNGISTTVVPKHSNNITDSFKVSKGEYQKAYKKGSTKTYLGTDQKTTTTTLKSKKEQKKEYKEQKTNYYKSKDWKNTKESLKAQNKASWFNYLTKQEGMSAYDALTWMASDEGKAKRKETYMESKDATKKAINKSIAKGIKDTSKLKSVNALKKGEFDKMVTASALGKDLGNKYLDSVDPKLAKKIGSKTAESAYKSKFATGVMQGTSKADIFSGSVGRYNAGAKEAIQQTKDSGAYLAGYGIGLAGDMAMGGVASRGASLAEMAGKGAGKLSAKVLGKEVAKEVPTKALQEAEKEIAKVSTKQGLKRFAQNRAGEFVAESPVNVLDAVKMSLDADGNLDKDEFKKWLAINMGATVGIGGAMEGIGAGLTRKLGNETLELMGKKEAGKITAEELAQLEKNVKKLSQKTKGNASISSDIANKRLTNIEHRSAQMAKAKAKEEAKEVPKGFHGGRRSRGQGKYTEQAKQTAKKNESARWNEKVKKDIADTRARTPDRPTTIAEKRTAKQSAKKHADNARRSAERSRNAEVRRLQDEIRTRREQLAEAEARANKKENTVAGHAQAVNDVKRLEEEIKFKESQLAKASEDTLSGRIPKAEKNLTKENTLQGHNKAVAEHQKLQNELLDDAKWKEKERNVEKALQEAKKKAEANPTPENKKRVELAEEALEKVKADAKAEAKKAEPEAPKKTEPSGKSSPSNPSPETKKLEREKNKAEKAYKDAQEAYEQWDKKGGEFYNKYKRAYEAGNEKLGKQYYTEYKNIQDEIAKREAERDRLKADFDAKNKEWQDSMSGGYARLDDEMPTVNASKTVDEVTKESEEGFTTFTKPARMEGNTINAETAGAKHPTFQKIREAFVSNEASLEDIAKKLPEEQKNEFLGVINEFRRAVKTGRAIVAERGRSIYKKYGLTKRGAQTAEKRKDFERYAFLMHELDRKKAGNNFTDMSRDEIRDEMKSLYDKYLITDADGIVKGSEVADFQKDVRNYFRKLLGREVDAGITTAEEAKAFMEKYPNYIPTYREADFDQILKRRTLDEIDVGRGIKQATGGSEREVVPLYNQMQVKTNVVMKRVQLNKMLKCLTYASGTTEKELDDALPWFKDLDKEAKAEALLDSQVFTNTKNGKNLAVMYHNGARIEISVDKEVYDAIRRWSGEDRKWVTLCNLIDNRAMRFVNSNFKKWITDYNLIFGVKNLKRDMATALFYTTDIKGFVKNMPKGFAICMLPDKMLTKDMMKYKKAYQVYKENGGVISQFIARDSASDTFFDTANKLNPLKMVENFNSAMETIPRMTEFISALDAKATKMAKEGTDYDKAFNSLLTNKDAIADAMYRAKDVTLNFDRSGWLGSKLNRGLVPFFNPAVQGLDKLGRKVITDNIKYGKNFNVNPSETFSSFLKTGVYLGGMVAMPAMAWNAVFGDYINGEKEGYEKQSDYNRYTNYLIPIGDGKFIKIPRARELSSLQSMIDFAYDNMKYGSGSTWEKLFSDQSERDLFSMGKLAWEQTGTLNPFQDSIFAPIWRVKNNQTWYGGKIESGQKDIQAREEGRYADIWDEKTSATAKWIGKKFNISPKKVDNVLDSYLGVIYDMGISQTSANKDFRQVAKEEGWGKGLLQLTRTPWGNAFIIDSVFSNSNKTDYYNYVDKRNAKLAKLKEGSDEYLEIKAEMTKDKNAYSYTSSQYDELEAQIWLSKDLTMSQKKKYVRLLKQDDNLLWNERKNGDTAPSKDPMSVIWNMKDGNGKHIMSTKTILESCSYTNKTTGKNTIMDAYDAYHALGGKSDKKFMEVTLSARDVNRSAGDSLSSPRWEVVAYANQLNHISNSDKVMASYIENDKKRNHLMANASIYEDFGGNLKTYKTMRKTLTQGVFDLGYDYVGKGVPDGVTTMILANARTKKKGKYRDLAYQANDWYIMDRMNAGRCLDTKKNGGYSAKDIKNLMDKFDLKPNEDYSWDYDKVISAINKQYPNASNETKSAMFVVITGKMKGNPFGEIGDYSLDTDTGVYCEGSNGWYGRGRRRRRRRHGGGGGRGSSFTPEVAKMSGKGSGVRSGSGSSGTKIKTTKAKAEDFTFKSNLNEAYRKKVKKLREQQRKK